MNGFTRMIFTGFFAATLLAMPTALAEREAGEVKEAKGDSQQAKVIKEGKQNLEEIKAGLDNGVWNDIIPAGHREVIATQAAALQ